MHAYPAALGLLLLASPAMAQQGAEPVSRRSDARAELTVGAGYQTGDYGYAQSPGAALADEQLLSARLTTDISSKLSLSVHGGAGLSKSAPDASASVQLGVRLF